MSFPASNIVYMGTPQFAVPTLQALAGSPWRVALVVTQPDRPSGRRRKLTPPPVKVAATELGLPVLQPEDINEPEAVQAIAAAQPDVIVTAAYGGYLRKAVRRLPRLGCINLHPSLLPRHRGAAPVSYTFFAGDSVTGNSIIRMGARMDAGAILFQHQTPIDEHECYTTLEARLAMQGADDVLHTLEMIFAGTITPTPQNDALATYTGKIEKNDLRVDWSRSAVEIRRHVRGLATQPAALTSFRGQPLKVIACRVMQEESAAAPGTIVSLHKNEGIEVATGQGNLMLQQVQPAGKRIMDAWAWHLGARLEPGEPLGDATC